MQRKKGTLTTIEVSILASAVEFRVAGVQQFHGFRIAQEIKRREAAQRKPAYGTLYRALDRMAEAGLLKSEWEDPAIAAEEGRPRRRFYEVTVEGEAALVQAAPVPAQASLKLANGAPLS
jgi:DNA-binding PadR family transcriptional regulator